MIKDGKRLMQSDRLTYVTYWLSYTQSGDAITSKSKKDGHKHEISLVKIKSNQVLLYINPWIIPTYVFLVSTSAVAD